MFESKPIFQPGDPVMYTGTRFRQDLYTKEGKPLKGWIHARVRGNPNAFVVEFPEAKDSDYVMPVSKLAPWRQPKAEKHNGPEISPRRRRATEEEV